MLKLVLVALFCAQAFARPSSDYPFESHVVGGIPADEGQFPFIVSLNILDVRHQFCGGALISDRYVLTAAHCVKGDEPSIVGIGAGSVNLQSQKMYEVDRIIVHPAFNLSTVSNDIALVRLSSPIPLGGNVQTIFPFTNDDQLVGKNVTAMGWGFTTVNGPNSLRLLYLKKSIVSNDFCRKRIGTINPKRVITPGHICMGSELNYGMCFGDSGSPLAYKAPDGKSYVVGIVSWGIPCAKGYPDVFTRVSYYAKWIKENMK